MHTASRALAGGADFELLGPGADDARQHEAGRRDRAPRAPAPARARPRATSPRLLEEQGLRVVVVRHPMPYGDLVAQRVQRYATYADLDRYETTIEEREEYEPHLDAGRVLYAGVDYEAILRQAEAEADVVLWDGGNNDFPFYKPDLFVVVADPLRAGHELHYHPGETNIRMADVVVINKVDSATPEQVAEVRGRHRGDEPAGRGDPGAVGADAAGRRDRGQAGGGRRGRPDAHSRRHDLRGGRRGRAALRRGRARRSGAVRHRRAGRDARTSTRPSSISSRRWATARARCTSSRRRSTPCRPTWSSRPRRSTSPASSSSQKPVVRVRYELEEIDGRRGRAAAAEPGRPHRAVSSRGPAPARRRRRVAERRNPDGPAPADSGFPRAGRDPPDPRPGRPHQEPRGA